MITPGAVYRAFTRVPLPTPQLAVQPPGGRTLVNFDTIFSTQADPFVRTVTLLGRRVTLDISPQQYQWRFGDGTTLATDDPGVPYAKGVPQERYLTHDYRRAGRVEAGVSVVWGARYRVGGGPWQPVPGTVTTDSPLVPLRVLTADLQLVGG